MSEKKQKNTLQLIKSVNFLKKINFLLFLKN